MCWWMTRICRCGSCIELTLTHVQDVSGGAPVAVEGTDLPLWGMEVDVERARGEIKVRPVSRDAAHWLLQLVQCDGGGR